MLSFIFTLVFLRSYHSQVIGYFDFNSHYLQHVSATTAGGKIETQPIGSSMFDYTCGYMDGFCDSVNHVFYHICKNNGKKVMELLGVSVPDGKLVFELELPDYSPSLWPDPFSENSVYYHPKENAVYVTVLQNHTVLLFRVDVSQKQIQNIPLSYGKVYGLFPGGFNHDLDELYCAYIPYSGEEHNEDMFNEMINNVNVIWSAIDIKTGKEKYHFECGGVLDTLQGMVYDDTTGILWGARFPPGGGIYSIMNYDPKTRNFTKIHELTSYQIGEAFKAAIDVENKVLYTNHFKFDHTGGILVTWDIENEREGMYYCGQNECPMGLSYNKQKKN